MAIDAYMTFTAPGNVPLAAESQVSFDKTAGPLATGFTKGHVFEIEEFSFGVETTLNIGSQSKGIGAGRATFNEFSVTRRIDLQTPVLFQMFGAGQHFQFVSLGFRKGTGDNQSAGQFYLRYDFKLVGIIGIDYSHDDERPKEEIKFHYGALFMQYLVQNQDGSLDTKVHKGGWNRVSNQLEQDATTPIS